MKQIIAIQGLKNSGKNACANYINYILNSPKWMRSWWLAKSLNFKPIYKKWSMTSYAHKMKSMLATLMGITIDRFEDRDFKENYYFDFSKFKLYHKIAVDQLKILSDKDFNKKIKEGNFHIAIDYILSIRQLLQFYGTEVMRNTFGDSLWTIATLNNKNNIIITDQRFKIENEIAQKNEAYIIHITRPNTEIGLHSSERELENLLKNKKYNVLLENNGTLKELYNNCKKIIDECWN